jgi:arylsulfatase A
MPHFRPILFVVLTVLVPAAPNALGQQAATRPPNIVVIMADDLGVECLSCYGSEMYETPHIDQLASEGMRFLHAHAQPICTPSRVQIMTGRYNHANYIRFGLLDPAAVTFANLLRRQGYRTCVAGKWQLAGGFDGPGRFGFDRYCLWQLTRRPSRYPNPGLEIDGRELDFKQGQFGPDLVTDYINQFMAEHRDQPFLVYYPMIAPHWPFVPTPDHPDWDPTMWRDAEGEPGGYKSQKYWDAMVRYTDKMVGKVVDQVDALGLGEKTLILWTADNGTFRRIESPFRGRSYQGGKGTTTDNGTHVGFVARWPGVIAPGSVSDSLVDLTDVLPTLLDVAGIEPAPHLTTDGVSLRPALKGQPRDKPGIFCWYERNGVREQASQHVRDRRYKLYGDGRFYNITADPLEMNPLDPQALSDEAEQHHARLQQILATRMAETARFDPQQRAKRETYPSRYLRQR